ncbi:MAG: hypothetical protein JWL77_4988 [Chthonomonadaceae bacterium]|nr:hypothetical protein [Chthonomonadaceae bacterium]
MVNGSFVYLQKIADAAGCDVGTAYEVAAQVLECLHRSALVNGLTGSLQDAAKGISPDIAYHLSGIYTAIADTDTGTAVNETLLRMAPAEDWVQFRDRMDAWEGTLTENQRDIIRLGREKD